MNATEMRKAAMNAGIAMTNLSDIGTQIDDGAFIVEVEVEGETRYVEFKATVKNHKDTKNVRAFDLAEAVEMYEDKLEERAEAAAAKAAKKSKKQSRKIEDAE